MEGTRLRIVTASDPNYMRTLEAAVRVGEPMLLKVGLLAYEVAHSLTFLE